jgi:hypothetical protein
MAKIFSGPSCRASEGLVPRDHNTPPVGYQACAKPFDCLPAGTLIRMADGSQKRIEDVKLLDVVLTAEGNLGRVMQCHVRDHIGEIVTIKAWGHGHLRMTRNHSVLTKRGYVPAGDLTMCDWIAEPRYAPETVKVVQTASHVAGIHRRTKNIAGAAAWETRQPVASDTNYNKIPDFLELSPGVGRIFGLYLAEGFTDSGSTGSHRVIWAFGAHEADTLATDLLKLLKDEW